VYKLGKNKKICLISITLFLGILLTIIVIDASKRSGTTYLEPLEYLYFWEECKEGDTIKWEFQGSNSYVGIDVIAMTYSNFIKFEYLDEFYYYELSNGYYYVDYGSFEVRSDDIWYIVFINLDGDLMGTYLSYEVNFKHAGPIGLIIGIIVGAIVIISVIGVITTRAKKQKEVALIQMMGSTIPDTMVQAQPAFGYDNTYIKPKYCTNCGHQAEPNAKFCTNCGAAFT